MDRRSFLGGIMALGCEAMLASAKVLPPLIDFDERDAVNNARFDDNLVAILSDPHINPELFQPQRLKRVVDDILRMRPLPQNVIVLGDLAWAIGMPGDYALFRKLITPIEKAGIKLTLTMGNHDRRKEFADAFPAHAAATRVPGRYAYIVDTPRVDIIVLDSLQESSNRNDQITEGAINEPQKEWLKAVLAKCTKPTLVAAHHPISETRIAPILFDSPKCFGYIHGHDHVWRPEWVHRDWSTRDMLRTLSVPSTGHWGDIGYTLLHMGAKGVTASLIQYEFFFNTPLKAGELKPLQWDYIEKEHRGATCSFAYK